MDRIKSVFLCIAVLFIYAGSVQISGQHHRTGLPVEPADPLSSATVSFGGWKANPHPCPAVPPNPPAPCPVVDRFPNDPNTQFPRLSNQHALAPQIARIRAGGSVNFIIGGFHVVTVYDNGTRPEDIDTTLIVPGSIPPIIDDPDRRIYRGLDPRLLPATAAQDRVEVVQFDRPGLYLVICSVLPHFQDGMYGYVRVIGRDDAIAKKAK